MLKSEKIYKLAKGHIQHAIISDLINFGETVEFQHYVKTIKYYNSYVTSFINLYERLKENGVNVKLELGTRNGYWTSKIVLN